MKYNSSIFVVVVAYVFDVISMKLGSDGKESTCQCRQGFDPWVRKIPWRREWLPSPVFLPGESHGQRSLMGYNPYGYKELDTMGESNTSTLNFYLQ